MTGRSPIRSVSIPQGTVVTMTPTDSAAIARPISPEGQAERVAQLGAEGGEAHPQARERGSAERADRQHDPAVARTPVRRLRGHPAESIAGP